MTKPLNRDEIIGLLDRLGGENDAAVLDAARTLHAQLADAGTTWSDLLIGEDSDASNDTGASADTVMEAAEPAEAEAKKPAGKTKRDTESPDLIEKLLAQPGISDAFRREMQGYKNDIAENAFTDADRQYLRALHKRLSGKR